MKMRAWLGLLIAAAGPSFGGEPLSDFEAIVDQCQRAYQKRSIAPEVVFVAAIPAWVKRLYGPVDIKYDVRRTESLVSPYIAEIRITELVASGRGQDQAEADAIGLSLDGPASRVSLQVAFAWRNGLWEVTGGTSGMQHRHQSGEPFGPARSVQLPPEQWRARPGPTAVCFGGTGGKD
jgi:hypothetical protein